MGWFIKFAGKVKLSQVTVELGEKFKQWRRTQLPKVEDTTVNIDIRTLRAAFGLAVRMDKMKSNSFKEVTTIRVPKKGPRPLTESEYAILMEKIEEPLLRDIVNFDILTGLRRGEITNLKLTEIDLNAAIARVVSSSEYHVKNGKSRQVPLLPQALEIVCRQKKNTEWVFTDEQGKRLRDEYISKRFKWYVRDAKLPEEIHFHTLRATCASWLVNRGVPIYAVKTMMGHEFVKTTEGYSHYDMEALKDAIAHLTLPVVAPRLKPGLRLVALNTDQTHQARNAEAAGA